MFYGYNINVKFRLMIFSDFLFIASSKLRVPNVKKKERVDNSEIRTSFNKFLHITTTC